MISFTSSSFSELSPEVEDQRGTEKLVKKNVCPHPRAGTVRAFVDGIVPVARSPRLRIRIRADPSALDRRS